MFVPDELGLLLDPHPSAQVTQIAAPMRFQFRMNAPGGTVNVEWSRPEATRVIRTQG
jgi:hypothetical protein